MATLRLQVTDGSTFIVRRLQKTPSEVREVAKISAMVAVKLRSPLVFYLRCPEGQHLQETICLATQAADTTTLAIMVQLLEGRSACNFCFSDVRAVAQFLILEEDDLTLQYMMTEASYTSPRTFKEIELLYVAGYSPWPNIYISLLADNLHPARTLTKAYELFPELFQDTDFFIFRVFYRFPHRFEPSRPLYFGLFGLCRGSGTKIQDNNSKVKEKQKSNNNKYKTYSLLHADVLHDIALIFLLILLA